MQFFSGLIVGASATLLITKFHIGWYWYVIALLIAIILKIIGQLGSPNRWR